MLSRSLRPMPSKGACPPLFGRSGHACHAVLQLTLICGRAGESVSCMAAAAQGRGTRRLARYTTE
jgi:hypothetical protein